MKILWAHLTLTAPSGSQTTHMSESLRVSVISRWAPALESLIQSVWVCDLTTCISYKCPVDAAGLGTPLGEPLHSSQSSPLAHHWVEVQFSSVAQSCLTLSNPMDCGTPGFPVHHQLPELTQTHVHRVGDATQPSHPLSSPSPPPLNLSHHQGLFQWVSSSQQVAKGLEFQLPHQSFQWLFRTDFL